MNTCVLVLGMFFLKLDDGYGKPLFAKVEDISTVEQNGDIAHIHFANKEIERSGWIESEQRYMTSQETMDLIDSCDE